jgi:NlpC/P60 family
MSDADVALAKLAWARDRLLAVGGGRILFTEANFMALIVSALGTPYLYGGVDPFAGGADCSGLIYWAGLQCVDAAGAQVVLPRTTSAEWAALPHVASTSLAAFAVGSICEFDVPSDGGSPPQHVGVVTAYGTMIDDPYTGAVVRREAIPNTPAIRLMGFCLLPFVTAAPSPPPPQEALMLQSLLAPDPKTGGQWVTDANGDLYCWGAAPFIAGLNQHPEFHAGSAESGGANPCVGIGYWAAYGLDGIIFYTAPTTGVGGWAGTPYSQYRFLRSGAEDSIFVPAASQLAVHMVLHPTAVLDDGSWVEAAQPDEATLARLGLAA